MSRRYGSDKYPKGFTTTLVRKTRKADKPTPGPWKLVYGEGADHDGYKIVGNGHTVSEYGHSVIPRDEMFANARLIVAAPDLLSACERALTLARDVHLAANPDSDFIRWAGLVREGLEAAIAKATGAGDGR